MKIPRIPSSEITSESLYLSRKDFIKGAGLVTTASLLAACTPTTLSENIIDAADRPLDEFGDSANTFEEITNYNNFYEFTTDKRRVAELSQDFQTSPWEVEVSGLVNNPKTFGMEDLLAFTQEERVYRLRCVEGWSMVIPWMGFPLSRLLEEVSPTSEATHVRFETLYDPAQLPGQESDFWYQWPYVEGLRLDEAMNDLTLLATGLYGEELLPQSGAPIRLVVPWKYGFKSIKSIVKIELIHYPPISLWMAAAPNEYGYYANVNPEVDHPRWSQSTERRLGENSRRETLMFNGYEEQVGYLYEGMDLERNF